MKQKRFKQAGAVFLIIIAVWCIVGFASKISGAVRYDAAVKQMETIDSTQLEALLKHKQEEIALIYLGRKTCPDCVNAISDIETIFQQNQTLNNGESVAQYYFDTEANQDEKAASLRKLLNIQVVPSVVVVRGEDVKVYNKRFTQIDLNAEADEMLVPLPQIAFGLMIPIYGNWCGLNYGSGVPIDYLDNICMEHKRCLAGSIADCQCNAALVQAIDDKIDDMGRDQKLIAKLVRSYYSRKDDCCVE